MPPSSDLRIGGGNVSACNGYNALVITKSVFPQIAVSPPSAEWHLEPDGNLLCRVSDEPGMNINRPANRTVFELEEGAGVI